MNDANAWLLNFGGGLRAAIGIRELVYTFYRPKTSEMPAVPSHCRHVIEWKSRLLPAWDLYTWVEGGDGSDVWPYAAVVAYREWQRPSQEYGVLRLSSPPLKVLVDDDDMCRLPEPASRWREVSTCCFGWRQQPTPILDLQRMFAQPGVVPASLPVVTDVPASLLQSARDPAAG